MSTIRRAPRFARQPMPAAVVEFFKTGEFPPRTDPDGWFAVFELTGDRQQTATIWATVQADVLGAWIAARPGTRPHAWWEFTSPRWQPADMPARVRPIRYRDFGEPRRRVGGIGSPDFAVQNIVPEFRRGVPVRFVDADPQNPPRYESEADYLVRHALLQAGEAARLPPDALVPEVVTHLLRTC